MNLEDLPEFSVIRFTEVINGCEYIAEFMAVDSGDERWWQCCSDGGGLDDLHAYALGKSVQVVSIGLQEPVEIIGPLTIRVDGGQAESMKKPRPEPRVNIMGFAGMPDNYAAHTFWVPYQWNG